MSFCIALAVRDLRMTVEEAVSAAAPGRRAGAAPRWLIQGRLAPGARADVAILEAASYADLVYRPGVPLVAATIGAGERAADSLGGLSLGGRRKRAAPEGHVSR